MRAAIWKYSLNPFSGQQFVSLPSGSTILTAQVQSNGIVLWAIVPQDGNIRWESHTFHVVTTGSDMPQPFAPKTLHYITTVQNNGTVYHIFEEK